MDNYVEYATTINIEYNLLRTYAKVFSGNNKIQCIKMLKLHHNISLLFAKALYEWIFNGGSIFTDYELGGKKMHIFPTAECVQFTITKK